VLEKLWREGAKIGEHVGKHLDLWHYTVFELVVGKYHQSGHAVKSLFSENLLDGEGNFYTRIFKKYKRGVGTVM
jgi:hypothetical protein